MALADELNQDDHIDVIEVSQQRSTIQVADDNIGDDAEDEKSEDEERDEDEGEDDESNEDQP